MPLRPVPRPPTPARLLARLFARLTRSRSAKAALAVEALEDRFQPSAGAADPLSPDLTSPAAIVRAEGDSAPLPQAPADAGPAAALPTRRELILIDSDVPDRDELARELLAAKFPGTALEVVELTGGGIAEATAAIAARGGLDAVHVISHGSPGALHLGSDTLDLATLGAYSADLRAWGRSLNAGADVLLYGCDLAGDAEGRELADRIAALARADVAASTDPTGSAALGGDWALEYHTGPVEAAALADPAWAHTLGFAASGANQLLNQTTAGTQENPQVAVRPDGSAVAVWDGPGPGGLNNVYARLLDPGGKPVGSEFQLNQTTSTAQIDPAVAVLPNGNFAVAWVSQKNSAINLNTVSLVVRVFSPSGAALTNEITVLTTQGKIQSPAIASDGSGNFAVAYDYRGTGQSVPGIFVQRFTSSGALNGGPITAHAATGAPGSNPAIAMNAAGAFAVTWTQNGGGQVKAMAQRFDASGTGHGEFAVQTNTVNNVDTTAVAMDRSGNFVVAWAEQYSDTATSFGILMRRYAADGTPLSAAAPVNTTTANDQQAPAVAMNGAGYYVVSWQSYLQDGSGNGVYARAFNPDGTAAGGEVRANASTAGDQLGSWVALNDAGQASVAWQGAGTGDADGVFAQQFAWPEANRGPAADILFATEGSVSNSTTTGLSSWSAGQVIQIGGPNFAVEPGTSGGTFSSTFDLSRFGGGSVGIDAMHLVRSQVTVGSGAATMTLLPGDLLLSLNNGATLTGTTGSLSVTKDEVIVFRPSAPGNYSAGSFTMLLDNFGAVNGGSDTLSIALVEADTLVGDYLLREGTFLYTGEGGSRDDQITIFTPTGVGAGKTAGTTAVLIDGGADLGMGPPIRGLDLVTTPTTVAGKSLAAGTLVLALDNNATVGSNGLAVTPYDVFTLAVTKTTLVAGRAVASASPLFQGSDAGLSSSNAKLAAVSLGVAPSNSPPAASADGYSTNEDTPLSVGAAGGVLSNDIDPDGDALTVTGYAQPAHGTVAVGADGSFTYTPAANYNGADSFTYTVGDGRGGTATATVAITVNPVNDPPVARGDGYSTAVNLLILSTPVSIGAPGVLGNDTDADGDPLTAQLVSGPGHGLFSFNANGSFSYTALLNFSGTDSFTYRAFDGTAYSAPVTVSINVSSPNRAPAAAADSYSTAEDTPLAVSAPGVLGNDSDPDGDTLRAVLNSGPAHGTLAFRADGSFTYTPNANYNGADSFTYHASDGSLASPPVTVAITVAPVNDPPVAAADTATTLEDNPVAVSVLANDSDVERDPLTVTSVGPALYGTVTTDGTTVTYTPYPNYNGADSFTYTVGDGRGGTATATVAVTVSPVNDPPLAGDDGYSTTQNAAYTIAPGGVLANDTDVDGDALSAVLFSQPANGVLTVNPDGSWAYTPASGFTGTDSFTYRASDGQALSNVATVTFSVLPPNGRPVASRNDSYAMLAGNALTVPASGVLANDTGSGIGALTALLVSGPSNGTLTLSADGSFTYTPNAGFSGTDTFNYKATDGSGTTGAAHVVITVAGANAPPGASGDAYATTRGATLTVAAPGLLANDSDPNGDALTVSLVGAPLHGALLLNADGSFTYDPDPGFAGTDAFTYRAADPYGATSGTAAVTIRVDAPAGAPGAGGGTSSASASAGSGTQVALGAPPIGLPRVDVASVIGQAEASSVASARADGAPAEDGAASAAQPAAVSFMIASNSGAPAALPAADAKPALGEVPAVSPKSAPPEPAAPALPQTPAVAPQNFAERPVASGPRPSPEPPDPQAAIEIVGESLEKVTRDIEADADERAATDAVVTTAAVATAGYVLLNTRAVYWFISALLARPAVWRRFDPIDVIYTWEKERPAGDEDESLQSMVG